MTFYKVKPEYDNVCLHRTDKRTGKRMYHGFLVANELYTLKEIQRMEADGVKGFYPYRLEPVEIKKNRTYWFFGARFAMEDENND